MRAANASFEAHLAQSPTSLCSLCTITRRDGTVYRFTDARSDLVVNGNSYQASTNFAIGQSTFTSDGAISTVELVLPLDGAIAADDVTAGLFDGAQVRLDWATHDDTSRGLVRHFAGRIGDVDYSDEQLLRLEVRSLLSRGKATFQAVTNVGCRADLGSSRYPFRCNLPLRPASVTRSTAYALGAVVRVPVDANSFGDRNFICTTAGTTAGSAPAYDYTVGNTTADGSAVFTAAEAWARDAAVASVVDTLNITVTVSEPRAVNDWFTNGLTYWKTGNLAGLILPVRAWTQSGAALSLWLNPGFAIQVGDLFELTPGCDKQFATCSSKFNNKDNFQGEPQLPVRSVR